MALLLTCGDGEERGEVYGCAADRQQASIVFEVAADMVRMCPALNKRVKILASQKRIVYQSTNSFYQVLSAEAYSKHGFNIHGVVFDELHTQPNRKLFDVMTKGSGDARTQPLYFLITTAGTDTNSICYETHQKAKDIIEGRKIDPTFYPVIYGAEETDDWTDPKVWKKANPSLGITVSIDKVQAACDSAKQNPGEENAFRQLRLNQWVKQAVRWMPMDKWDACNFHVNEDDLEGRVCYGGLDLSSTTDITAFVLVFPPMDEDDKFAILPYFWIPEDTLELRVRRDHVPYDIWERQGFLQTRLAKCGADMTRVRFINEDEKQLSMTDDRIEKAIRQNSVRLMIMDPIQAYLGANVDMNRANEIRPLFRHLSTIAERTERKYVEL